MYAPVCVCDTILQVSGLLLSAVYFVWLGFLIEKTVRHTRDMNAEYIFIMVITLVTIFGAMSAVFTGALAPDQVCQKLDITRRSRVSKPSCSQTFLR